VRLLNRTTRSVAPTAAGERLLTRLRPLARRLRRPSSIRSTHSATSRPGCCALRCRASGELILAPLLSRFFAQYPAIDSRDSSVLTVRACDIVGVVTSTRGMRPGERVERDMIAVRVGEAVRGVIVAAPDYLARHRGR